MTEPLEILFEDPHCLAVVKPAGLLTQATGATAGAPTLEEAVRRHLNPGAPGSPYLGTVHRLDRAVSGVIVWAKTPKAARRLADQFAGRAARKEYWAIIEGTRAIAAAGPKSDRDEVWDDWLAADPTGLIRATATALEIGAQRAITRVRRLSLVGERLPAGTTWLRLWPETGRTHQLRAQAAYRGTPILGDVLYGATRPFAPGIALHARALTIRHPVLKTPLTWVAPLPAAWGAAGIVLPEPPC
jgi:23S rRNA pseudouridine1911/1915/1917 synthase